MANLATILGIPLPLAFLDFLIWEKTPESEGVLATVIVIGIIVYIIALIFSKTTSCIIIYGWKDFLLVAAPMTIYIISIFFGDGTEETRSNLTSSMAVNFLIIIPIIATFAVSIIVNLRYNALPQSIFFAIISIIAKPVVMLAVAVFALLSLGFISGAYKPGKKDARYKTGYRPSENQFIRGIVIAVVGFLAKFLIGGIIKRPQEIQEQNEYYGEYVGAEDSEESEGNKNNEESEQVKAVVNSNKVNWLTTFILCLLLGWMGIHRFYVKKIISGVFMLLTVGGFGLWWLIDLILILTGSFKDKEGNNIRRAEK